MGWPRQGWLTAGAWSIVLVGVLLVAAQGACGALTSPTCGGGGIRPQPQIGGQLVYNCAASPAIKGDLYLLNLSTGNVRRLTSDGALNTDPGWSPDGLRLAFQSTRGGRSDLYMMSVETGSVRWLTGGAGFNELPRWSPDGSWITFNSSRDGINGPLGIAGFHRDVYEVRPDGSQVHRLTTGYGFNGDAAWSPDGSHLAFTSDRGGAFDLYTMAPDGSGIRQLTDHRGGRGFASYASWSPAGTEIVFDATNPATDPSRASLYRMNSTGGVVIRVTHGYDIRPDWSQDGTWIAFVGKQDGHTQLFAVRPDGSDLTQLTSDPSDKDLPRWRPG